MSSEKSTTERALTDWAVRSDATPFTAPELRRLYLSGMFNGSHIETSHVVEVVAPRVYRTRSGSIYRLVGDPEPGYVTFCVENKVALDLADPIKLKGHPNG